MQNLQQKIDEAWKTAMKERDPKKDTLSLIRTDLKNKAIETRKAGEAGTALSDELALDVLRKMAKKRRESIEAYETAGRAELRDKEAFELKTIEEYLPKPLSEQEIKVLVKKAIAELGTNSIKDMGKIIGKVVASADGRADGHSVQKLVKEALS